MGFPVAELLLQSPCVETREAGWKPAVFLGPSMWGKHRSGSQASRVDESSPVQSLRGLETVQTQELGLRFCFLWKAHNAGVAAGLLLVAGCVTQGRGFLYPPCGLWEPLAPPGKDGHCVGLSSPLGFSGSGAQGSGLCLMR